MTQSELIARLIIAGILMWVNGFCVCLLIQDHKHRKK